MNAREERRKAARDARAAKRARYRAEADAGKSRRDADARARFNPWKHAHVVADCGNAGCLRCRGL